MPVEVDGWSWLHTSKVVLLGGTIRVAEDWEVLDAGGISSLTGGMGRCSGVWRGATISSFVDGMLCSADDWEDALISSWAGVIVLSPDVSDG